MRTLVQVLITRPAIRQPGSCAQGKESLEVLLGRWNSGAVLGLEGRFTGLLGERTDVQLKLEESAAGHVRRLSRINVPPERLEKRAVFCFDDEFEEHEYHCDYSALPAETIPAPSFPEEFMSLSWFPYRELPFPLMPADDEIWYPPFLDGKLMTGSFYFDQENPLALSRC
eukprot:CAMPEP_0117682382 /NCGR_PEP_ID=MMETSP0804-20121206/19621_1 /TAXON_ID=1074897 /ORGANISM="Tetraselmis astigmatica, Strain CCMP880" /LENGTH=169 /DNA_ID=CAMNT_0005492473 /DNA_START=99 /DNA_END=605 /DNA_ORIENTATION=+